MKEYQKGLLGSPNPSANLIGVHQAYDEAHFELVNALSSFEFNIHRKRRLSIYLVRSMKMKEHDRHNEVYYDVEE